ncbi:MAG: type IV conjugative transfer system protein TraL [Planctomycetota bacterium]
MGMRSHARPCARTLDRPITILGMEPEELVLIGLAAGAVMFLVDPVPAVVLGVGLAFLLNRVKAGKPDGYLYYLVYRSGAVRYLPGALRAPHLVLPPRPGAVRRVRLSAFPGEEEEDVERFYWGKEPRL